METLSRSPETFEWFINEWVHLIAVNPETYELSVFENGQFHPYKPLLNHVETIGDVLPLVQSTEDNLAVYTLS